MTNSERMFGRCNICGRINKPNHNVICALYPNRKRRKWEAEKRARVAVDDRIMIRKALDLNIRSFGPRP
jgi:hypothetical protein